MKWIKVWFWSSKPESENWAQTLVRIFGNLLRISLTICFVGVVAISVASYLDDRSYELTRREVDRLNIVVKHRTEFTNPEICSEAYPLFVSVSNRSERALTSLQIDLEARVNGRSTNLLDYLSRTIDWDTVVLPNHFYFTCYSNELASERSDLIWAGTASPYSPKFSVVEEWMTQENLSRPIENQAQSD